MFLSIFVLSCTVYMYIVYLHVHVRIYYTLNSGVKVLQYYYSNYMYYVKDIRRRCLDVVYFCLKTEV